jgi:hypothetical protein
MLAAPYAVVHDASRNGMQANAALDPAEGILGDGLSQLRFDDGLGEREDRSGAPTEQAELPPWACS